MGADGVRRVGPCSVCLRMWTWCDAGGKTCGSKCRQQAYRDRKKIDKLLQEKQKEPPAN